MSSTKALERAGFPKLAVVGELPVVMNSVEMGSIVVGSRRSFIRRRVYKDGETVCYDAYTPIGDLTFSGKCPEIFALQHAERMLDCGNCLEFGKWNGHYFALCANCGMETGCQKGFIDYGEELEDNSRPSVFNTYLQKDWNLQRIGDILREDTIGIMVDELFVYLNEKYPEDKADAVRGLCDYLRSLTHNPREAIHRIKEVMDIPDKQLYDRNWAYVWGPHFDSNGEYIGGDYDDDADDIDGDDEDDETTISAITHEGDLRKSDSFECYACVKNIRHKRHIYYDEYDNDNDEATISAITHDGELLQKSDSVQCDACVENIRHKRHTCIPEFSPFILSLDTNDNRSPISSDYEYEDEDEASQNSGL